MPPDLEGMLFPETREGIRGRGIEKWALVVPSNRPEQLSEFMRAWTPLFEKHSPRLYIIEDLPPWRGIPDWAPRRTDMIRSWGFFQAWDQGSKYVLTLDDDVRPIPGVDIFAEYEKVFEAGLPASDYLSVGALTTSGLEMRGFPYRDRIPATVAIQWGGWSGILDYDAATQLACPQPPRGFLPVVMPVPKGAALTGCIMNCAWRNEYTPLMWQLPLLDGRYNRTGDIWSGLFAKKTCDQHNLVCAINGRASVNHERASDPLSSIEREAPGLRHNEHLWDSLKVDEGSVLDSYRSVTDSAIEFFSRRDPVYAEHFMLVRDKWLSLFA